MERKVRLIRRKIELYKGIMLVALPITAQSLITIGVNMMDNIMVGTLGETALSAVRGIWRMRSGKWIKIEAR